MGTRGKKRATAFKTPSGWVEHPSDRRTEVEAETGLKLSDAAWNRIDLAYNMHVTIARNMEEQGIPLNERGRTGWASQHAASVRRIEKARALLVEQRQNRGVNAVVDAAQDRPFRLDLEAAIKQVDELFYALRNAETPENLYDLDLPSAKKRTVKEIAEVVKDEMPVEAPKTIRASGLTDFQRLIKALRIHEANSDEALAKWLAEALHS